MGKDDFSLWQFTVGGAGRRDDVEQRVPPDTANELAQLILTASCQAKEARSHSDPGDNRISVEGLSTSIESIAFPDLWIDVGEELRQLAADMITLHQSQTISDGVYSAVELSQDDTGWNVDVVLQNHRLGVKPARQDSRIRLTSSMYGVASRAELGMREGIGDVQADMYDRYHALSTMERHGLTWLFLRACCDGHQEVATDDRVMSDVRL